MTSTMDAYGTVEYPVCWDRASLKGRTTLHAVRMYDVAGENEGTFINALLDIETEMSGELVVDGLPSESDQAGVVLLLVLDLSKPNDNFDYINPSRLRATLGNRVAKRLISSIVVFVNKSDHVPEEQLEDAVKEMKARFTKLLRALFEEGYGQVHFFAGSVLRGNGVHSCYGQLLRNFQLDGNFQEITGAPPAVDPAQ